MTLTLPLTVTVWSILLAFGVVLAGLGWEYRRRPIFGRDESGVDHWTNDAAYAVMVTGRVIVFAAVILFVGGQVAA